MGLITCPECGREGVSDKAAICPGCGFEISTVYENKSGLDNVNDTTKTAELKEKKRPSKTIILLAVILLIIVAVGGIFAIKAITLAPAKKAMKLISTDLDNSNVDYELYDVFYSKSENKCIVYMKYKDKDDVAIVDLDKETYGRKNAKEAGAMGVALTLAFDGNTSNAMELYNSIEFDSSLLEQCENGLGDWKLLIKK